MSSESYFPVDLNPFVPYGNSVEDYLSKILGLKDNIAPKFVDESKIGKVSALNGMARRAIVASHQGNVSGWRHISDFIYEPNEEQRAMQSVLSRTFTLNERERSDFYRFYVDCSPYPAQIPFVQLVRAQAKSRFAEMIGGPQITWSPDGSNGSVRVLNPVSENSVTDNQAGICAIQSLALIYFNKYYKNYFIG